MFLVIRCIDREIEFVSAQNTRHDAINSMCSDILEELRASNYLGMIEENFGSTDNMLKEVINSDKDYFTTFDWGDTAFGIGMTYAWITFPDNDYDWRIFEV